MTWGGVFSGRVRRGSLVLIRAWFMSYYGCVWQSGSYEDGWCESGYIWSNYLCHHKNLYLSIVLHSSPPLKSYFPHLLPPSSPHPIAKSHSIYWISSPSISLPSYLFPPTPHPNNRFVDSCCYFDAIMRAGRILRAMGRVSRRGKVGVWSGGKVWWWGIWVVWMIRVVGVWFKNRLKLVIGWFELTTNSLILPPPTDHYW